MKYTSFKNGLKILIDNQPYTIIANEFEKPGKGQAFTRLTVKNLLNGKVIEKTMKSGHSLESADIQEKAMTYLYHENGMYFFMDPTDYEQIEIPRENIENQLNWMKENSEYKVLIWNGQPVSIEPETSMVFKITECEPNVKGDTATGVMKNATIETGANIRVPGFIKNGESIKVDTRTGEYLSRA